MSHALEQRPSNWIVGLIETDTASGGERGAAQSPSATHDLTSVRIQSLASRGLIDPKSLKLREIQELSASIMAHIRELHRLG